MKFDERYPGVIDPIATLARRLAAREGFADTDEWRRVAAHDIHSVLERYEDFAGVDIDSVQSRLDAMGTVDLMPFALPDGDEARVSEIRRLVEKLDHDQSGFENEPGREIRVYAVLVGDEDLTSSAVVEGWDEQLLSRLSHLVEVTGVFPAPGGGVWNGTVPLEDFHRIYEAFRADFLSDMPDVLSAYAHMTDIAGRQAGRIAPDNDVPIFRS